MTKNTTKLPHLEEGLLKAMQAIDNQVAREMQRTPEQRAEHGVQKWEPFLRRVERISSFILNSMGENQVSLDALLVLSQATSKALQLTIDDLGSEGLGSVRTQYCISFAEALVVDLNNSIDLLRGNTSGRLN